MEAQKPLCTILQNFRKYHLFFVISRTFFAIFPVFSLFCVLFHASRFRRLTQRAPGCGHKKIHAFGVVPALVWSALAAGGRFLILKNEIVHIMQHPIGQSVFLLSLISFAVYHGLWRSARRVLDSLHKFNNFPCAFYRYLIFLVTSTECFPFPGQILPFFVYFFPRHGHTPML